MGSFKDYVHEDDDVKATIKKLPKQFQDLVKNYEVRFEIGNTLKNDDGHVGVIISNPDSENNSGKKPKQLIRISSPWNYGREFTFLHEIGHLVFEYFIKNTKWQAEWSQVCKLNPNRKKDEPDEENFCHSFASFYCKNPVVVHDHKEWRKFIQKISILKKLNKGL